MHIDARCRIAMLAIVALAGASARGQEAGEKSSSITISSPAILEPGESFPVKAKKPPRKPASPSNVVAADQPNDLGEKIDVTWDLSPMDVVGADPRVVVGYSVSRSSDDGKTWLELGVVDSGKTKFVDSKKVRKSRTYRYQIAAVGPGGKSVPTESTEPARAVTQLFDWRKLWFGVVLCTICGTVVYFIFAARKGRDLRVRKIAGLEVVDEAVGRATEMGRSCLFVPGINDMNEIQTVAAITILSRVARTAAEYDARVEVPTSRSLVMTAARDAVQSSYLLAGRPDAYNPENISYVTDEQFGYVAYLSGKMVREKPAACFYMGAFYAESLVLAETGNSIGAIQVAGTAEPSQLPFFVAACDYTLIGEEFLAASAYLSGEPDQLGSLKGQDLGKLIVVVLMLAGCALATWASIAPDSLPVQDALNYLTEDVLNPKGGA